MKAGIKLSDFDHGYKGLFNRVYGLEKPVIDVGIFGNDADQLYEDGVSVLEVAMWNEFGTETIPERSFIRAWFDENQAKARKAMYRLMEGVVAGKYTKEQALELLAQKFVGEIQRRIARGIDPINAPETVKRKGSSVPLIDTGQLRASISYAIDGVQSDSKAEVKRQKAAKKAANKKSRDAVRARKALVRKATRSAKKVGRVAKATFRDTKRTARNALKKGIKRLRKALS